MAWFGTKFEQNCWRIAPGLSAYSSQQQEKAERQQKTSRVQFCSNLVPNHFTGLSVAPRSLADSVHKEKLLLNLASKGVYVVPLWAAPEQFSILCKILPWCEIFLESGLL